MSQDADAIRVWFRLLRLGNRIRVAMAARLRKIDLSLPQCDVLTTLTEEEGISQQDLAKKLYVTKGNISGLVDRLNDAGLVERRSIDGDRRSHALYLTDAGRSLALSGIAAQHDFVARSFGRMDHDRLRDLERLLVDLRTLVREAVEEDAELAGSEHQVA